MRVVYVGKDWGGELFPERHPRNIDGSETPLPGPDTVLSEMTICDICGLPVDALPKVVRMGSKTLCKDCARG